MTVLSIKEMVDKTEKQRKDIERQMDGDGYDFDAANLIKSPEATELGKEDVNNILETIRTVPLKEFFAKSSTTGIAGAAYLIPDKIHSIVYDASVGPDICADISLAMVTDIPGSSLKVDIAVDGSYVAAPFSSGGKLPDEEIEVTQATITPISFGIAPRIGNDLVEDTPQVDLIDWHLRVAGAEMGDYASYLALTVLAAGTDGDGTINTVASDTANITHYITMQSCIRYVVADEWEPNTCVITPEAFLHNVTNSSYFPTYAQEFKDWMVRDLSIVPYGKVTRKFMGMDTIFSVNSALHSGVTSNLLTTCLTLIFDKSRALLTGRKRWLRIENYSDPIRDLAGCVISARQDSVTVYDDAIAKITEA